jgi:hypothetical protein
MTFITSDSPARSRRLSMMASGALMRLARPRAHHAADVRRHHHHIVELKILADVAHHHRRCVEIVGRDVEEALDLPGVQVERHHPVGAGVRDQVCDQLRRDRRARSGFAILPRVAEIGDHRRDAPRRRPPQRVGDDQQLHQMVVGGERSGLDDEAVRAAHVLLDLDEDLHVGEASHHGLGQWRLEVFGDALGKSGIRIAGDELDCSVLGRHLTIPKANWRARGGHNKAAPARQYEPGALSRRFYACC